MNSKLKVKITQVDDSWINIILNTLSSETILEASEYTCDPLPDLINAIIKCYIYRENSEAIFDTEGNSNKIELIPNDDNIIIKTYFIKIKKSFDMPGNYKKDEELEFESVHHRDEVLTAFWRGIKEHYVKTGLNLNDIASIESKVKELKANK